MKLCFHHQSHPQLGMFLLWLCLFILSGVISPLISSSILGTYWPGEFIFQCPIFLPFHIILGFSWQEYCGVGCHSLLQWTTFCRFSLLWPVHLGWPCTAWLLASLSYTSAFVTRRSSVKGRLFGEVEVVGLSDCQHNMERKGRGCQECRRNHDMPWEGQVWREEQWL